MGEDAAFQIFAKGLADIGPGAVVVALAIELTGTRFLNQASVSVTEKIGSLTPWYAMTLPPRLRSADMSVGLGGVMKLMADSV
jgi:hypothetical protein